MDHVISLHLNAAKIGFTQRGEQRNGPFRDAGHREFVGEQLLQAVSRFYHKRILSRSRVNDDWETADSSVADAILEEANRTVKRIAAFFDVSIELAQALP